MPTVVKPSRRAPAAKSSTRARSGSGKKAKRPNKPVPKSAPRKSAATVNPSWAELAGKAPPAEARRKERAPGFVDAVPTLRFAVLLAIACAVLTLYVGHLYASQTVVEEVQELRKDKLRLTLQHNRLRGEFDRMTAPSVILHRAEAIGLRGSGEYGPAIAIPD